LLQNARDAEVEFDAPMSVTWSGSDGGTVYLRNVGERCHLDRTALLLGETSKAGRKDLLGRWGDGLKVGTLALVRAGCEVRVRTGRETWTARIGPAAIYGGAEVLNFDISVSSATYAGVEVRVRGINQALWSSLKRRFRWLTGAGRLSAAQESTETETWTSAGCLIRPPATPCTCPTDECTCTKPAAGSVFVRGIWVEQSSELRWSYDFSNVELDVDRQTVKSWDLHSSAQTIWEQAMQASEALQPDLFELLLAGAGDVYDFRYGTAAAVTAAMGKLWRERHGTALPVASADDKSQLEYLGAVGIHTTPEMCGALRDSHLSGVATATERIAALAVSVVVEYSTADLSPVEQDALLWALILLEQAGAADGDVLNRLRVVEFNDAGLLGLWAGGQLKIARKVVQGERLDLLRTLVHELAHDVGSGHDKAHLDKVEQTWAALARILLQPSSKE